MGDLLVYKVTGTVAEPDISVPFSAAGEVTLAMLWSAATAEDPRITRDRVLVKTNGHYFRASLNTAARKDIQGNYELYYRSADAPPSTPAAAAAAPSSQPAPSGVSVQHTATIKGGNNTANANANNTIVLPDTGRVFSRAAPDPSATVKSLARPQKKIEEAGDCADDDEPICVRSHQPTCSSAPSASEQAPTRKDPVAVMMRSGSASC